MTCTKFHIEDTIFWSNLWPLPLSGTFCLVYMTWYIFLYVVGGGTAKMMMEIPCATVKNTVAWVTRCPGSVHPWCRHNHMHIIVNHSPKYITAYHFITMTITVLNIRLITTQLHWMEPYPKLVWMQEWTCSNTTFWRQQNGCFTFQHFPDIPTNMSQTISCFAKCACHTQFVSVPM
jgi:hypothetical protein